MNSRACGSYRLDPLRHRCQIQILFDLPHAANRLCIAPRYASAGYWQVNYLNPRKPLYSQFYAATALSQDAKARSLKCRWFSADIKWRPGWTSHIQQHVHSRIAAPDASTWTYACPALSLLFTVTKIGEHSKGGQGKNTVVLNEGEQGRTSDTISLCIGSS